MKAPKTTLENLYEEAQYRQKLSLLAAESFIDEFDFAMAEFAMEKADRIGEIKNKIHKARLDFWEFPTLDN